jgi:anti-sigma regulatory factor (Ser/Thr protein kinase)/succinate dehydrogenase hydrophobic anchor subunit
VLLILLARPAAGLFLQSDEAEVLTQTTRFIRVAAAQLLLMSVSFALSGAWQGLRHIRMNYILDILRECVLPLLCVTALSSLFGLHGFETSFPVSGALVLMLVWILPSLRNRKLSFTGEDILMLPDDFGSAEENIFEATVRTMQDVTAVSEQLREFCMAKGTGKRTAMRLALFAEEMASNAVEHGFSEKKPGYLDIRYVYSPEKQVIRFRDNGKPFDPVDWLKRNQSEDKLSGAGIRIIVGLAHEVKYIPALGLNNLMITMQS